LASAGVSLVLLAVKFTAYYLTGSAAVFSDALESVVNVLASGVAAYSLWLAHQPADATHPYGHGKVEFLSSGFEGGMILLAALVIAFRAVESIVHGPSVEQLDLGLVLLGAAGAVNAALGTYLVAVGRRGGSSALTADGWHLLSDALTTAAVLVSLLLVRLTGAAIIDPIAALVVAASIAWLSARLLVRSSAGLMDQQDQSDTRLLRRILDSHVGREGAAPQICSYHKLRHRHSGRYHWIDFHLVVPAAWDVRRGHDAASAIEHEIEQVLGGDATAHVEPCDQPDCPACRPDAGGALGATATSDSTNRGR
jgi:cation diffusion facilitator family transporter